MRTGWLGEVKGVPGASCLFVSVQGTDCMREQHTEQPL
jgi:hypothetical protein